GCFRAIPVDSASSLDYNIYNKCKLYKDEAREVPMVDNRTRVLLILSQDALDRARVLAGRATTALKLPVSLQIVLRALIEEGLKREDRAILANVEAQAHTVRRIRSTSRRGQPPTGPDRRPTVRRPVPGRVREG